MFQINISEFIPPIFHRAITYLRKKIMRSTGFRLNGATRMPPFDAVPADINVRWVLDIGANQGDVAEAALVTYPNCHVICFEPVKATFANLTKKLQPFADRIHLYNLALSDQSGAGEINLTTFHGANSILPQAQFHKHFNPHVRELGREEILLAKLDDFASNFPNQQIDVLKIDVEGYELNVLKGGVNFIKNNVDTIIIEIALMRDSSWETQGIFEIFSLLHDADFRLINVVDLCYAKKEQSNQNMLLVQMDCVFRKKHMLCLPA